MEKQRVLYIHQHFVLPTESGGTRSWEFARRLVADGFEVTVLAGGPKHEEFHADGIHIVRLPVRYDNKMSFAMRVRSFAQFTAKSTRFALTHRCETVFATSTPLTVAIPGMASKLRWRNRFVFEVRDLWPAVPRDLGLIKNPVLIRVAEVLEKITYRTADHVIALSPGMADGVRQVNRRVPITTIPNASDIELFRPQTQVRDRVRQELGLDDSTPLVFYAGSMGPIYNIEWIVRTAAALRTNKVRFVAFGAGKTLAENRELAHELGMRPEELLPGPLSKEAVAEYMQAADVVLSSVQNLEPLHPASINKAFDAMAASKPIILNHDGWMTELIVQHSAGWRVDEDPAVAAEQLRDILANDKQLATAGQASGQLGKDKFDRNDLYQDLRHVIGVQRAA